MIITLKGADFSANNIGQVNIERVLNPYTVAAIEASGNTSLTEAQKFALDDLFLAMGVDGSNTVMSKMRKLYIPMIGGTVGDAFINYATNDFTKDVTPNSANWKMQNLGITKIDTSQPLTTSLSTPITQYNITALWLRTENMVSGTDDTNDVFYIRGVTDTTKFMSEREGSATSNTKIEWQNSGYSTRPFINKSVEQRITTGFCLRSSSDKEIYVYENGNIYPYAGLEATVDMAGESTQTLYLLGKGVVTNTKPMAFIMLGEGISHDDFLNVRAKVDALYDALKA